MIVDLDALAHRAAFSLAGNMVALRCDEFEALLILAREHARCVSRADIQRVADARKAAEAERDALRAEVARLTSAHASQRAVANDLLAQRLDVERQCNEALAERDEALAELRRLRGHD